MLYSYNYVTYIFNNWLYLGMPARIHETASALTRGLCVISSYSYSTPHYNTCLKSTSTQYQLLMSFNEKMSGFETLISCYNMTFCTVMHIS